MTNDDGVDARGLPILARNLRALGEVEVVVPHIERSWVGKAITRFEPVRVDTVRVDGFTMHTTTGYPADCVQLGIHALFDRKPALVVSGINFGYNHGSAYMQSSGTVGAVLEAAIAEVPGIAFSTGTTGSNWKAWRAWAESPDSTEMWERLAGIATAMAEQMLSAGAVGTVSVGLPDEATLDSERRVTHVADVGYDRLFAETAPGVYQHSFGGMIRTQKDLSGTDVGAAHDGVIAITPVEGAGYSERSKGLAERLARW